MEILLSFCIIKSYFLYNVIFKSLEGSVGCKYIYIVWNFKDVFVFYFCYIESFKLYGIGFNGFWDFFIDLFMKGKGEFV